MDIPVEPIHPPDSDTAWATIVTGLDPSEHGIIKYDDPLEKSQRLSAGDPENTSIRGRTFWDEAGRMGKRVCILFPHLGYPIWPVNGIMIGRSGFHPQPAVFPDGMSFPGWNLSALNVVSGMPDRAKKKYLQANRVLLENQAQFGLELLDRESWDLFFLYSSVLDMVQHYFWNYCDPEDPAWPGPNPFRDVIHDFYCHQDDIVGRFLAKIESGTIVYIVSDHGHGMRPMQVFNINEFLRRKGWLVLREEKGLAAATGAVERSKTILMNLIGRWGLGTAASRILHILPFIRRIYSRPLAIDWTRTRAYATNLSGIKAYSYGGVVIPHNGIMDEEYEETRSRIMEELSTIRTDDGKPVFLWVRRREALYHGQYLEKYPDILFEMRYGLGAGLIPDGKMMGLSPTRQIVPGSHRGETAVFIRSPQRTNLSGSMVALRDVYRFLLEDFHIAGKANKTKE
jgi:predicted AlkP superfamily phosphohydrolase/phosphomutase